MNAITIDLELLRQLVDHARKLQEGLARLLPAPAEDSHDAILYDTASARAGNATDAAGAGQTGPVGGKQAPADEEKQEAAADQADRDLYILANGASDIGNDILKLCKSVGLSAFYQATILLDKKGRAHLYRHDTGMPLELIRKALANLAARNDEKERLEAKHNLKR